MLWEPAYCPDIIYLHVQMLTLLEVIISKRWLRLA